MRWPHFIILQCLLIIFIVVISYGHKDRLVVIKKPPASLSQWYKPENKRQVWLHNMFKLRREIQAVKFYAETKDPVNLKKWFSQLNKHYLKIGEMVPEWKNKLNIEAITNLQNNIKNNKITHVAKAIDDLNDSCQSCHTDYRIVTASMYRAPNFTSMEITSSLSYKKHMKNLIQQVNSIKIASEDGMKDLALSSLARLSKGMNTLGQTCSSCHKKDTRPYPDDKIKKTISNLEQSLKYDTLKKQGENLGTLAVLACARCHGTHRLAYDNRKTFTDEPDWPKLIKH